MVGLLGFAQAQELTQYANKFYACSNANGFYCTNGKCYQSNPTTLSGVKCSTNFTRDYSDPAFPSTYSLKYDINHIERIDLKVRGDQNPAWVTLREGESVRLSLKSIADKSAFVDMTYNDGAESHNKDKGQVVAFYVFNDRL